MCAMAKLRTVFDSLEQVVDDGMHTQCTKFFSIALVTPALLCCCWLFFCLFLHLAVFFPSHFYLYTSATDTFFFLSLYKLIFWWASERMLHLIENKNDGDGAKIKQTTGKWSCIWMLRAKYARWLYYVSAAPCSMFNVQCFIVRNECE